MDMISRNFAVGIYLRPVVKWLLQPGGVPTIPARLTEMCFQSSVCALAEHLKLKKAGARSCFQAISMNVIYYF